MNWTREEFLTRHTAAVTGRADWRLPAPLADTVFNAITRREEIESGRTDQWGNWEWPFSEAHRAGKLYRPWLDEMVQSSLAESGLAARPVWPENKAWALCLSHDVDGVSQHPRGGAAWTPVFNRHTPRRRPVRFLRQTLRAVKQTLRGPLLRGRDPLWCYERWVASEEKHGFKSSMLFAPFSSPRRHEWDCSFTLTEKVVFDGIRMTVGEMIRRLSDRGFDCGVHGSYYSYDDVAMLAAQKRMIEDAAGREVVSTRQHYLHYHSGRSPQAQASAGLQVDSTQGFNRNIGFRAGTSFPYWCWDHAAQKSLPILEVPLTIMDGSLFASNSLEYDADQAVKHTLEIMDAVRAVGGCLTLNWHLHLVNDPVVFETWNTLLAEAKARGAWGCTLRDLLEHRRRQEQSTADTAA